MKLGMLLPFIYWSENKQASTLFRMFTPLLWKLKKPSYSVSLAFPFWFNYRMGTDTSGLHVAEVKAVTPFYWRQEDKEKVRVILFPLYSKSSYLNGDSRVSLLGILYRQQVNTQGFNRSFLWPLVIFRKDSAGSYSHIAPVYWNKNSRTQEYLSVQPFFYRGRNQDTRYFNILWQLVNVKTTPERKTTGILFHTIHREEYTNGDHAFRLFYLLYANVEKRGNVEKCLLPFYYRSNDTSGNSYFNCAFAFYSRLTKKVRDTSYSYHEERIFWIIRWRSNFRYLQSKGVVKSRKEL